MKTIYDPGWGVVWRIYSKENLKKSIWLPLILTVVSFAVCFFSKKNPLGLIEYVGSTILSVGPNMLGFTLSGYALMMGLSNSEFIQGLINFREEGKEYSLFQSLNTVFAVVLGMMFLTTHRLSTQRLATFYSGRFPSTRLRTVHTGLPVHGSPPSHSV